MQPASHYLWWAHKWLATARLMKSCGRSTRMEVFAARNMMRRYRLARRLEAA
jgi:hypothetical protein